MRQDFMELLSPKERKGLIITLIGAGALSIMSIFQFKKLYKKVQLKKKMHTARIFWPSDLKKQIKNKHPNISRNYSQIDKNRILGKDVLIQGLAFSDYQIHPSNSRNQNISLILKKEILVKKYSNQSLYKYSHIVPYSKKDILQYMDKNKKDLNITQAQDFYLKDQAAKHEFCKLNLQQLDEKKIKKNAGQIWGQTKVLDQCLDYQDQQSYAKKISNFKYFLMGFFGVFEVLVLPINWIFNRQPFIKGVQVGEEHYEVGISQGQGFQNRWKAFHDYKSLENMNFDEFDDSMKCIICIDKPRSVILKPCMHTILCQQCCSQLAQQKNICPICKEPIKGIIDILVDNRNFEQIQQSKNLNNQEIQQQNINQNQNQQQQQQQQQNNIGQQQEEIIYNQEINQEI
ncbi:hypothetical protein PPERSA_05061 [Pseudocohnilembus persalinus]|uniref:RING-type domain-containing protein n=1 Tax=Pseudocohnilembus persalinus TaxID=266149 RepID=A0A0V0QWR3_PSEPJ|nr:hypothetical protein PPERSA_05061 [Pseudocohnilembus persalinus]|eukprot:KRX06448.1 hypothetical protein PPERSA_05061 [Pseudocohnilembus persalinus]